MSTMSTMTAAAHQEQSTDLFKRAQNRRRNADDLWHLFSHTHDPRHQNQLQEEAKREDRAADQLTNAAEHHADQAYTQPETEESPTP